LEKEKLYQKKTANCFAIGKKSCTKRKILNETKKMNFKIQKINNTKE